MKKYIYVALFVLLGLIISTLIHALVEILTIKTIINDLERYGESFVWQNWSLVHGVGSVVLWVVGLGLGWGLGLRFWHILYVEKRYGRPRF